MSNFKASPAPEKSWQSRIATAQDSLAVHFVESLSFDHRLAKPDKFADFKLPKDPTPGGRGGTTPAGN